jgi:tetratricopeptide (TPR) repeat protein
MSSIEALIAEANRARRQDSASEARRFAEAALSEAKAGNDPIGFIHALKINGQIARDGGQMEAALAYYLQAEDRARLESDALLLAHTIRHVGDVHWELGDADLAEASFEEALAIYRLASPSDAELANALRPLAILRQASGDFPQAYALFEEACALYQSAGIEAGVGECKRAMAALSAGP